MNTSKNTTAPAQTVAPQRRPNEHGTISVQGHVRIFDPKTQKTIVEARG
jgi:hypothetical protein